MKYILMMILSGMIISCSSGENYKMLSDNFEGKGIVVIGVPEIYETISSINIKKKHNLRSIELYNAEKDIYIYVSIGKDRYINILLDAGSYYVIKTDIIEWKSGDAKRFFGKFIVEKNQIVYLGDLQKILFQDEFTGNIKFIKTNRYVCLKNNLPEAKSYMQNKLSLIDFSEMIYRPLEIGTQVQIICD